MEVQAMTVGEAVKQNLVTVEAFDAAIATYLADPTAPAVLEIGDKRLDVAAAVLAQGWATEDLIMRDAISARRRGATEARRRDAVRKAILLAPVG